LNGFVAVQALLWSLVPKKLHVSRSKVSIIETITKTISGSDCIHLDWNELNRCW
jgi:hypothetical protein